MSAIENEFVKYDRGINAWIDMVYKNIDNVISCCVLRYSQRSVTFPTPEKCVSFYPDKWYISCREDNASTWKERHSN